MKNLILVVMSSFFSLMAVAESNESYFYYNKDSQCGVKFSVEKSMIKDIFVHKGTFIYRLSADHTRQSLEAMPSLEQKLTKEKIVLTNNEVMDLSSARTVLVLKGSFEPIVLTRNADSVLIGPVDYRVMPLTISEMRWFRETKLGAQSIAPVNELFYCPEMSLTSDEDLN